MTKDEALRMALEALEIGKPMFDAYWGGSQFDQAITAIKKALAQPEQEPVAWGNLANWCLDSDRVLITDKDKAAKYNRDVYDLTPLYTHPPVPTTQPEKDIPKIGCVNHDCDKCKAQPEQEPEDLTIAYMAGLSRGKDLAPQRKPLTDEQRNWIVATCPTPRHIIDTVEKMHGIKE